MSITEIVLSDDEMKALQALADRRNASVSDVIKEAIQPLLCEHVSTATDEQRARAMNALGKFASQEGDISLNHDKYFVEAIEGK